MRTREEKLAYNRAYYRKNRERLLIQKKEYLQSNHDLILQRNRGYGSRNRERQLAYMKRRYELNKDRIRKSAKESYLKNRPKRLLRLKQYRDKNRDLLIQKDRERSRNPVRRAQQRACQQRLREKNKERFQKYNAEYYQRNRERLLRQNRKYQIENPAVINRVSQRHRALKFNANTDKSSVDQFFSWIKNQDFVSCTYCGIFISGKTVTIDHIVPLSRGGDHLPDNFALACKSCNCSKHDLLLSEWPKCPEKFKQLHEAIGERLM